MGKAFTQVTMEERCEIARLRSQGSSVRQIAAGVDRPPSTVARELKRNGFPHPGLPAQLCQPAGPRPSLAGLPAGAGRSAAGAGPGRSGRRLVSGAGGRASRAGRGRQIISHESIYRFIYAQMARKKDYAWRHYLPRAKAKRGFRGRRGGSPATHIAHRVPLSQRPHAAADRATFGHWEGDLMHFGNHGPALLALAERHSRLVLLARLPGKGAEVTADTIARLLAPLPPAWRQTITFDNGTEFARHYPPPCPGHPDLLLRYPIPLAEGGRGERHRPPAAPAAPHGPFPSGFLPRIGVRGRLFAGMTHVGAVILQAQGGRNDSPPS